MEKIDPVVDKMNWVEQPQEPDRDIIGKPPSKITRYGSGLILLVILILLVLAWYIKLPEVIAGSAVIGPDKPVPVVKANTGGKLDLVVTEGENVKAGNPLYSIDSTGYGNDVLLFKKNIFLLGDTVVRKGVKLPSLYLPVNLAELSLQINKVLETGNKNEFQRLLQKAKDAISGWEAAYLTTSPVDGKVALLRTTGNVSAGDTVMALLNNSNNTFSGRLSVPAKYAAKIKKGQEVNISLSTHPVQQFGTLTGVVETISVLPVNNQYEVMVSLPHGLVTSYNYSIKEFILLEGNAGIAIEKRSLLGRIFNRLF